MAGAAPGLSQRRNEMSDAGRRNVLLAQPRVPTDVDSAGRLHHRGRHRDHGAGAVRANQRTGRARRSVRCCWRKRYRISAGPMAGVDRRPDGQAPADDRVRRRQRGHLAIAAWLLPRTARASWCSWPQRRPWTRYSGRREEEPIPAIVDEEDLLSANAWLGTALNMQVAIGPLLGGLFVATLGMRDALAVDAVSFLLRRRCSCGVETAVQMDARLER